MTKEKFPYTGDEIRHLRKRVLCETLDEFGRGIGASKTQVHNWEKGVRNVGIRHWEALLNLFNTYPVLCEWSGVSATYHSTAHDVGIIYMGQFNYCPECGRKIKLIKE